MIAFEVILGLLTGGAVNALKATGVGAKIMAASSKIHTSIGRFGEGLANASKGMLNDLGDVILPKQVVTPDGRVFNMKRNDLMEDGKPQNMQMKDGGKDAVGKVEKGKNEEGLVLEDKRVNWNGYDNVFKANFDEIVDATSKILNHRKVTGNLKGGNYGYIEGAVKSKSYDIKNTIKRSSKADLMNEPQIFDAIEVKGDNERTWLRNTDSEYKMLNQLAQELGGVKGEKKLDVEGEIKIVSENPYCTSCTGVIEQFNDMFPNVKLILVDGAKAK